MSTPPTAGIDDPLRRLRRPAMAVGVVGTLACALAAAADASQVLVSWLAAWWFVLALTLGSMAIATVHRLTGGPWGRVVAAPLAAAALTMPLTAALALPLLFATRVLFPWADAGTAAPAWYLNVPFFRLRTMLYLAIWLAIAAALARDVRQQRSTSAAGDARVRRRSIVSLLAYALTVTFAAIDWIMSLTPGWSSTTFGLLAALGQTLTAFAFCVACVAFVPSAGGEASERDWQDLGNLLLMFAMTWAYLAFTQFLIIWAEDLPREISWYLIRRTAGWEAVAVALAVSRFGLPMAAMLFRPLKRNRAILGAVCATVVAAGWLEATWLVAPPFRHARSTLQWTDVAALLAVGGLWLAGFTIALTRVGAAGVSRPLPT